MSQIEVNLKPVEISYHKVVVAAKSNNRKKATKEALQLMSFLSSNAF